MTAPTIARLNWVPLLIDILMESGAWNEMRDYQFAWYVKLLVQSTRSQRLGYLRLDGQKLWQLAGARSRQFFESENVVVMARFKVRDFDGQDWIYNQRMLSVLEDQSNKFHRRSYPQNSQNKQGEEVSPSKSGVDVVSKPKYSEEDFCERDYRKVNAELQQLYRSTEGKPVDEDDLFSTACVRACITVKRGRHVMEWATKPGGSVAEANAVERRELAPTSWAWRNPA